MLFHHLNGLNIVMKMLFFIKIVEVFSDPRQRQGHQHKRILGGQYADQRQYPYIVSIQVFHNSWSHTCGGSILNQQVILTACHCLYVQEYPLELRRPFYTRVVAGTGRLDYWNGPFPSQQEARAHSFHTHPNCGRPYTSPAQHFHDVGMIILKTKLRYTAAVQPLQVFSSDPKTAFNELLRLQRRGARCESPGWGLVSSNPETTTYYLKVAYKTLLTSDQCNYALCPVSRAYCVDFDLADQVCAYGPASSVCNGDSGGPFVCNGFVFGVVSYGPYCGIKVPQVYSSIKPILYYYNYYNRYAYSKKRRNIKK